MYREYLGCIKNEVAGTGAESVAQLRQMIYHIAQDKVTEKTLTGVYKHMLLAEKGVRKNHPIGPLPCPQPDDTSADVEADETLIEIGEP